MFRKYDPSRYSLQYILVSRWKVIGFSIGQKLQGIFWWFLHYLLLFPPYILFWMASFLFDLAKYFVTHGCFMYQEYFVRIIMNTCHWVLSELYLWLVWLFSVFLFRRIAPLICGSLKIFHMLKSIFRFLFIPHSIICSYTISPRQCK